MRIVSLHKGSSVILGLEFATASVLQSFGVGFAGHNINFENSYSGGCIHAMIDQSWVFERYINAATVLHAVILALV